MSRELAQLLKLFGCVACLMLASVESGAQETMPGSIHWAYSSYFGSGWYKIGPDQEVFVVRVTPRWEKQEANYSEDGERTIGIEFLFPITAGLDKFSLDDISGIANPDNLASLSVTPAIDITIPVTERWWLRPYAAIGWGTALNGSESAWSYSTGLYSRYTFQRGKLNWALINSVSFVGSTPSNGPSDNFWPLMAGLEFDYPLGKFQLDNEQLLLAWHGTYTSFQGELRDLIEDPFTDPITDQWEIGVALRKQEGRIKIGWFKFDRLGLGYRFSSSGDLKGITFIFRSVFEK